MIGQLVSSMKYVPKSWLYSKSAEVDGVDKVTVDYVDPNVTAYIEDPVGQDITGRSVIPVIQKMKVKNHGDLDKIKADPKHPGPRQIYT